MSVIRDILYNNFESKRPLLSAVVTSVPRDIYGKSLGYIRATIAGKTSETIRVGPDETYFIGSTILVEQRGTLSSATYHALGNISANLPTTGMVQFAEEYTINDISFLEGDLMIGNPFAGHWHFVHDDGRWDIKYGSELLGSIGLLNGAYDIQSNFAGAIFGGDGTTDVTARIIGDIGFQIKRGTAQIGIWDTEGVITLGEENKSQIIIDHRLNSINFMNNSEVIAGFDADTLSMTGWQRWGHILGPSLEVGEVKDIDENGDPILDSFGNVQTRWVMRGITKDGIPFFSFMTGTVENPEDAEFQFGRYNDDNRITFSSNILTSDGNFNIRGGTVYGSTDVSSDGSITWDDEKGVISSSTLSHTEDANNYVILDHDESRYMDIVIDSDTSFNGIEIVATGIGATALSLNSHRKSIDVPTGRVEFGKRFGDPI